MSSVHHAFQLDFGAFEAELLPLIDAALSTGECANLVSYIQDHLAELSDPYEGKPLPANWESLIETNDAHQYGDLSLTKFYDPTADIGLGDAWTEIQEIIDGHSNFTESPILGAAVGPPNDPFDPGKMGAYFQSEVMVARNHQLMEETGTQAPACKDAVKMLAKTRHAGKGLYVTF